MATRSATRAGWSMWGREVEDPRTEMYPLRLGRADSRGTPRWPRGASTRSRKWCSVIHAYFQWWPSASRTSSASPMMELCSAWSPSRAKRFLDTCPWTKMPNSMQAFLSLGGPHRARGVSAETCRARRASPPSRPEAPPTGCNMPSGCNATERESDSCEPVKRSAKEIRASDQRVLVLGGPPPRGEPRPQRGADPEEARKTRSSNAWSSSLEMEDGATEGSRSRPMTSWRRYDCRMPV